MSIESQVRSYAGYVVAQSVPADVDEVAATGPRVVAQPQPRRRRGWLVAVGAALVVLLAGLLAILATSTSTPPVVTQPPPTTVPSPPTTTGPPATQAPEAAAPPEVAEAPPPPTEDEMLTGAVLEAAETLDTTVRRLDTDPSFVTGFAYREEVPGLIVQRGAALGAEESDMEFSLLAFDGPQAASDFLAVAVATAAEESEEESLAAAAELGDEAELYIDCSRGCGNHLLIRQGRYVLEISHAVPADPVGLATAVLDALLTPSTPRLSVVPAAPPAAFPTGYTADYDVAARTPDATLRRSVNYATAGVRSEEMGYVGEAELCSGHTRAAFLRYDDGTLEDFDTNAPIAADDPGYLEALRQCHLIPLTVGEWGLDLDGSAARPIVLSPLPHDGVPSPADAWRYRLDEAAARATGLAPPDVDVEGFELTVDGSRTYIVEFTMIVRGPGSSLEEAFGIDLTELGDLTEVDLRIHYQSSGLP